jgi:hypothetical protein
MAQQSYIPFKPETIGKQANPDSRVEAGIPLAGLVTPTAAESPNSYPSVHHSLQTHVGNYAGSKATAGGLRDENFWKRAAVAGLQTTFASFVACFITNLAYVVTKQNGTFNDITYSLLVGLSVGLQLYLTNGSVHYLGCIPHALEIWMEHYSTYIVGPFYRIILWLILLGARLAGYTGAVLLVWDIQANNAVTHAGLPLYDGVTNFWHASFLGIIAFMAVFWVFLRSYNDPDASSDVNRSNAPMNVALTAFVMCYLTLPYIEGGFDFERYVISALFSGFWQPEGWLFAVGPVGGTLVTGLYWYWVTRTTKITDNEKSD